MPPNFSVPLRALPVYLANSLRITPRTPFSRSLLSASSLLNEKDDTSRERAEILSFVFFVVIDILLYSPYYLFFSLAGSVVFQHLKTAASQPVRLQLTNLPLVHFEAVGMSALTDIGVKDADACKASMDFFGC
jgi:hypothetical protein